MANTLSLGLNHFWLDSLCIMQDNDSDKLNGIRDMHRINGQARCPSSANRADQKDKGCLATRDPALITTYIVEHHTANIASPDPQQLQLRLDWDDSSSSRHEDSVLATRGRRYQGRILSPRIPHCGEQQYHWECRILEASEAWSRGRPEIAESYDYNSTRDLFSAPSEILEKWPSIVHYYTSCNMTVAEDRLHDI